MAERLQQVLGGLLDKIVYVLPAVIVALVVHETAHAVVAYCLGDTSQKERGRLSLNPLKHIDPFGFVFLLVFGFGWAKPVMVEAMRFKKPKAGMVISALAGPFSNFILAFLFAGIYNVCVLVFGVQNDVVISLFETMITLNVGLGLFNLIPFPPLDGSKIFYLILKPQAYAAFAKIERYGFIFLFLLFSMPFLTDFLIRINITVSNAFLYFWYKIFSLII